MSQDAPTILSALGTSAQLAEILGAELLGSADVVLTGVETLERAGPESLSFVRDSRHLSRWGDSACGAAMVTRSVIDQVGVPEVPSGRALLLVDNADLALVKVLGRLSEEPEQAIGVDRSASVAPSAVIAEGVSIGFGVEIGAEASIGDHCLISAGCVIGARVKIGAHCVLRPRVVVQERCELGERCVLHPGVVIGADGFGYVPSPDGQGLVKIPHIGNVVIGCDVEIGANSCIDRAKFGSTLIGDGTKIDNLVQIGHGCRIGRCCIICGVTGLAGSITLGDGVTIAGFVGIADNLTIGARATIAAKAGVTKNVPADETWLGFPARPSMVILRQMAALEQLPEVMRKVRRMLKDEGPGR